MTLAFLLSCPKLRLFANDSMLYTSISSNQSAEKLAKGLDCPSYVGHHVATLIQSYKDLWSVDFLWITTITRHKSWNTCVISPFPKVDLGITVISVPQNTHGSTLGKDTESLINSKCDFSYLRLSFPNMSTFFIAALLNKRSSLLEKTIRIIPLAAYTSKALEYFIQLWKWPLFSTHLLNYIDHPAKSSAIFELYLLPVSPPSELRHHVRWVQIHADFH